MAVAAEENRRLGPSGALVVVAAVAVTLTAGWWTLLPSGVLWAIAALVRPYGQRGSSVRLAAVCWGAVGVFSAASFGVVWPIPQLLALAAVTIVLRRQGSPRPAWLRAGVRDRTALVLALASIPLTTIALVAFIASGRTDLDAATEGLHSLPGWTLPLVGVGFVLANPTVEEVLFRGVLQSMITEVSGRIWLGIVVQGLAFGAIHYAGVPGGPLGMAMAATWGVMLGIVRHRTGSVGLVWVVHLLANVAIYSTIVTLAISDGVL